MTRLLTRIAIGVLSAALVAPAHATLTIEITRGVEGAAPIAVVPFAWDGNDTLPEQVGEIIEANLERSGRFEAVPESDFLEMPGTDDDVNFRNWRVLGAESLVVGSVEEDGGRYVVRFKLYDVYRGNQMAGYSIRARPDELRRVAHRISDVIFEQLTGQPGAFATSVAYITADRDNDEWEYRLQVADADGHNSQTILRSSEPLMSPAWSPDGRRIAYVSFENRRPEVFVQDVATGSRESVAAESGINSAPAWSPDGRRLAVTLSREDTPNIYILDLENGDRRQITDSGAIDTEPEWSPDGDNVYFTSDRGGRPQIYRTSARGGDVRRVTFEGNYNARPRFSPDGNTLAMVHGRDGRFRIAVQDLESGLVTVLSNGDNDEAPSFAPNGSMILYSTHEDGRGVLAAVSVDGRVHQRLVLDEGNVREPAWSPFDVIH